MRLTLRGGGALAALASAAALVAGCGGDTPVDRAASTSPNGTRSAAAAPSGQQRQTVTQNGSQTVTQNGSQTATQTGSRGGSQSSRQSSSQSGSGSGSVHQSSTQSQSVQSGGGSSSQSSQSSSGSGGGSQVMSWSGTGNQSVTFTIDRPSRLSWTNTPGQRFVMRSSDGRISIDSRAGHGEVALEPGTYHAEIRGATWTVTIRSK